MALIVCTECGKKISDTCARCIHCGAPIQNEAQNHDTNSEAVTLENNCEQESFNNTETSCDIEEPIPYSSLTKSKKDALEDEFLRNDTWAYKYYRQKSEFKKFRGVLYKFILWVLITAAAIITISFVLKEKLLLIEHLIINKQLLIIAPIAFVILAVLCVAMFLYGIICPICFAVTHKKYIYSKRYRNWLLKEKNIDYMPYLSDRGRYIFDSINID